MHSIGLTLAIAVDTMVTGPPEDRSVAEAHMATNGTIEERLAAVETAVAELQRRLASAPAKEPNWVERFTGSFKDEPAFVEVVEYGRALRSADRAVEVDGS
jgi:hypothetical protein